MTGIIHSLKATTMTDSERPASETTAEVELLHDEPDISGTSLILPDKHLPARLKLLPIPNRPVFPGQVLPVTTDILDDVDASVQSPTLFVGPLCPTLTARDQLDLTFRHTVRDQVVSRRLRSVHG